MYKVPFAPISIRWGQVVLWVLEMGYAPKCMHAIGVQDKIVHNIRIVVKVLFFYI